MNIEFEVEESVNPGYCLTMTSNYNSCQYGRLGGDKTMVYNMRMRGASLHFSLIMPLTTITGFV